MSKFTLFNLVGLLTPLLCGPGCKPDISALSSGSRASSGGNTSTGGVSSVVGGTSEAGNNTTGAVPNAVGGGGGQSSVGVSTSGAAGSGVAPTSTGGAGGVPSVVGGMGGVSGSKASTASAGAAGVTQPCIIEPFQPSALPALKYDFDTGSGDVATDSSGHSRDGLLLGAPTWNGSARIAGGLTFNGANQYVELPANVVSDFEAVTVAAWVKISANATGSTLFDFGSSATNHFYLRINSGNTTTPGLSYGAQTTGGGAIEVQTAYGFPTAVWKHVALSVGDGTATLFVDGQPVNSRTFNFVPRSLGETAGNWIARTHSNTSNLWGTVDDFRVYDRALGREDILALAGPGSDYQHWAFEEPCGTKAFDRSAKALVAELPSGGTWEKGRFGGAVQLNGSSQYLEFPSGLLRNCSDLTVAMWVQRGSSVAWERLFSVGNGQETVMTLTPATPMKLMRFSARLNADTDRESSSQQLLTTSSSTQSPQSGIWSHVAVVLQAGTGRLYSDGQEVASGTISIKPSDMGETSLNAVGKPLYLGEPYLAAVIDELLISCRAYVPAEIKLLAAIDP